MEDSKLEELYKKRNYIANKPITRYTTVWELKEMKRQIEELDEKIAERSSLTEGGLL